MLEFISEIIWYRSNWSGLTRLELPFHIFRYFFNSTCISSCFHLGEAAYIDCEGSFAPERCWSMANALVDHVQSSARRHGKLIPNQFNAEHILNGIHVYKVHDEAALKATVWNLPLWIEKRRKEDTNCLPIKLVLVDSIAFHYRVSSSCSF